MSDDFLKQFANALADEHDGATAVPEATRGRVIRALAEKRRRSRKWWVLGVPAFAIFAGSTAWAAATGRLPTIVDQAVSVFAFHQADERTPDPRASSNQGSRPAAPLPEAKSDGSDHSASDPPEILEEPAPPSAAPPANVAHESEAATPPRTQESTATHEAAVESQASELSTYRAAHRAQFQHGDCSTAVFGYQKYLNEDPAGSFALEAKYNRGVCLAKLGRTAEAISALQPFADGQFGAYRQDQSQALIEALTSNP